MADQVDVFQVFPVEQFDQILSIIESMEVRLLATRNRPALAMSSLVRSEAGHLFLESRRDRAPNTPRTSETVQEQERRP